MTSVPPSSAPPSTAPPSTAPPSDGPRTTVVIATRNAGKLAEFVRMFASLPVEVRGLSDFPSLPEVIEDADTFQGNADKKAISAARALGHYCIADDSGLEVDALDGQPGIYSARYAGVDATDAENLEKLLRNMDGIADRRARFRCALSLADPSGQVIERADGVVEGHLVGAPRGDGGFGYDPIFVPVGLGQTMAELEPARKNALSHRGDALKKLWPRCVARFGAAPEDR